MYSIKTVEAYIKGEDIEKYTIEELENDPTFMRMIVLATNDKNIYFRTTYYNAWINY